jgi:Ca2+-binding RTX toxin-like protein
MLNKSIKVTTKLDLWRTKMVTRINELQENSIQSIRGRASQVEDDSFLLRNSSGSITVSTDSIDDDDISESDLNNFLNGLNGKEVTVVGELDNNNDDNDDTDGLDFDALRITGSNEDGSLISKEQVLEDADLLNSRNNNFVQKTSEAVIVNGRAGNDSLTGAEGDDFLIGGAGNDRLTGAAGFNTYVVGNGADVITDFERADVIVDRSDLFDDIGQILDSGGAATQVGQDTVIDLGDNNSVTLLDFNVEDLNPANFDLI